MNEGRMNRRKFFQYSAAIGVAGQALLHSRDLKAAIAEAKDSIDDSPWPKMSYRKLGRTNYNASRLVFGCGAALSRKPNDKLLETAFSAGVNVFDVGFRRYYRDAEANLSSFANKHRDEIFLISKAYVPIEVEPNEEITPTQAKEGASAWLKSLDESLKELKVEQVDAYYTMAAFNPYIVSSDELQIALARAKQAGKTKYLGLSCHQNQEKVLEAAIQTGSYDMATLAITPGGWYDWKNRNILEGSPKMTALQPQLARARQAGIGLVGMKAGRFLAGRKFLGWGSPGAFNEYYSQELLNSDLSDFQRSYAFVLAHGLDAVNADMQNYLHLKENFVAAATSHNYFNIA